MMNFLGALGWVLFAFVLGFGMGMGVCGVVMKEKKKEENVESDQKVAEK